MDHRQGVCSRSKQKRGDSRERIPPFAWEWPCLFHIGEMRYCISGLRVLNFKLVLLSSDFISLGNPVLYPLAASL